MTIHRTAAAVLLALAFTAGADSQPKTNTGATALTASQANLPKALPAVQLTMPNFAMVPGETRAIHATMKSGDDAVAGKKIWFFVTGKQIGSATTDGAGKASFDFKLPNTAGGTYEVHAKFTGDSTHRAADVKSSLLVAPSLTETKVEFTTVGNEGGSSPALLIFITHVTRKSDGQKLAVRTSVKVNGAVYHNAVGEDPKTESPNVLPSSGHAPWSVAAQYTGDAYTQASSDTKTHP
jgi:Bacterial Ig-like domain (group 3)